MGLSKKQLGGEREGSSRGEDMYVYVCMYVYIHVIMTDSHCCMAETNKTL